MTITESQLHRIIEEENVAYYILTEGYLEENLRQKVLALAEKIKDYVRLKKDKMISTSVAAMIAYGALAGTGLPQNQMISADLEQREVAALVADEEAPQASANEDKVAEFVQDWADESYSTSEEDGGMFEETISTLEAYASDRGKTLEGFLADHWSQGIQARKAEGGLTVRDLEFLDQIKTLFSDWLSHQRFLDTGVRTQVKYPHLGQTPEESGKEFGTGGQLPGEKSGRGAMAKPRRFA